MNTRILNRGYEETLEAMEAISKAMATLDKDGINKDSGLMLDAFEKLGEAYEKAWLAKQALLRMMGLDIKEKLGLEDRER